MHDKNNDKQLLLFIEVCFLLRHVNDFPGGGVMLMDEAPN